MSPTSADDPPNDAAKRDAAKRGAAKGTVEISLAWILAAALVLLHVAWRPVSSEAEGAVLYFGWMPAELAYRLGWMGLAWIYLEWFTRRVWSAAGTDPSTPAAESEAA